MFHEENRLLPATLRWHQGGDRIRGKVQQHARECSEAGHKGGDCRKAIRAGRQRRHS